MECIGFLDYVLFVCTKFPTGSFLFNFPYQFLEYNINQYCFKKTILYHYYNISMIKNIAGFETDWTVNIIIVTKMYL